MGYSWKHLLIGLLLCLVGAGGSAAYAQEKPARELLTPVQRAVTLESTRNTRDLGGVPVPGGRFKMGTVYRSGALCFINGRDVEKVRSLGLRTIVDLRVDKEIAKEGPDRPGLFEDYVSGSLGRVPRAVHLPMYSNGAPGGPAYISYVSVQEKGTWARHNREAYKRFFTLLSRPHSLPLLFHCSAGKDRTGIMAALLYELLEVPRSFIMDDYLQSRRNSAGLKVDPSWLQGVWQVIDGAGGIRPFLRSLGLEDYILDAVRTNCRELAK